MYHVKLNLKDLVGEMSLSYLIYIQIIIILILPNSKKGDNISIISLRVKMNLAVII